jgi:hypothetical protein
MSAPARRFRLGDVDHIFSHTVIIRRSFPYVLADGLRFFLTLAHRACGFAPWVQTAHLRFVSIARSVPLRVAHPPPKFRQTEFVCPTASALDCIEDVCLDAPINFRTALLLARID